MLGIAWVETTRDGTKIGFLFRICFTAFLTIIGRGAQPKIGRGARSDVTVVLVMEHNLNLNVTKPKPKPKRKCIVEIQ